MKHWKRIAAAALAATALTALLGAGSASATTLEVGGVKQNGAVALTLSLQAETSLILRDTFGFSMKTCTAGHIQATTASPYTGTTVTAPISSLSLSACDRPFTVHKAGRLHFQHTSGTNSTVTLSGFEGTTSSPFGTLNCKTNEGTHLGTLMGTTSGHAAINVNAVVSCSGISSRWISGWTVTSPTGLGATA